MTSYTLGVHVRNRPAIAPRQPSQSPVLRLLSSRTSDAAGASRLTMSTVSLDHARGADAAISDLDLIDNRALDR